MDDIVQREEREEKVKVVENTLDGSAIHQQSFNLAIIII